MTSKQKRKIARENGAKAAGTKSPAGIAKPAMSSLQHDQNAKALVLSTESMERFHELLETYLDKFQPQDGVEMKLIEEMVAAKWRQQRVWMIQTTAFELEMDSQLAEFRQHEKKNGPLHLTQPSRTTLAFTAIANKEKTFELLLRSETSFSRMHDRAEKALERLRQKSKLQNEPKPEPEASEAEPPTLDTTTRQTEIAAETGPTDVHRENPGHEKPVPGIHPPPESGLHGPITVLNDAE